MLFDCSLWLQSRSAVSELSLLDSSVGSKCRNSGPVVIGRNLLAECELFVKVCSSSLWLDASISTDCAL